MKNKSPTTRIFLALLFIALLLVVHWAYFEYCISREMPTLLISVATFVVTLLDIWALVQITKTLKQILKF